MKNKRPPAPTIRKILSPLICQPTFPQNIFAMSEIVHFVIAADSSLAMETVYIPDVLRHSHKLKGLKDSQRYRLYIWAHTKEGMGDEYVIEDETLAAGGRKLNLLLSL